MRSSKDIALATLINIERQSGVSLRKKQPCTSTTPLSFIARPKTPAMRLVSLTLWPNLMQRVSSGKTQDEAIHLAQEALQLHINGMVEDGDTLPTPYTIDALPHDPELHQSVMAVALIDVIIPSPPKRINISLDAGLLAAIDARAAAQGLTRSGFLAEASRQLLHGGGGNIYCLY
jgi:predicted RNase H-like HicB family nuclease